MSTKNSTTVKPDGEDVVAPHLDPKRSAEATKEAQARADASEKAVKDAAKKGEQMKDHKQDPKAQVMQADQPADPGAIRLVELDGTLREVGQEDLGMGPLKALKSVTQPPAASFTTYTGTGLRLDGSAGVFVNPSSGTAMGAQGIKTTGTHHAISGGRTPGVVFADILAGQAGPSVPVYSDRVAGEADLVTAPTGGQTATGQNNPMRLKPISGGGEHVGMKETTFQGKQPEGDKIVASDETRKDVVMVNVNPPLAAPGIVQADRHAEPYEMVAVVTPQRDLSKPVTGGGELLGMGETRFLGGHPDPGTLVALDHQLAEDEKVEDSTQVLPLASREGAKHGPAASDAPAKKASTAKADKAAKAKNQVVVNPQVVGDASKPQANADTREQPAEGQHVEIETKEIKSTPSTEKKDEKVESGTKAE